VRLSLPNLVPIAIVHALALLALDPDFFSALGVWTLAFFTFVVAPIGINLCYHRALTHRSLKLARPVEYFFVLCALCCLEGPPGQWVAAHRAHHKHSDRDGDPHSPRHSFFWAHIGWLFFQVPKPPPLAIFARDILSDPFYRFLQTKLIWAWIYLAHALLMFALGAAVGWLETGALSQGLVVGTSVLVWGVFLRTVVVWHITWSVNSVTHMFGYRNYGVKDTSRNNWVVALLATGEGWHNNHHADPASACNSHKWWEVDLTWSFIRLLQALGLADDVVQPRFRRMAGAQAGPNGATERGVP
jgi:stearoyl-CoA desaturase (delta-9 desaturase)